MEKTKIRFELFDAQCSTLTENEVGVDTDSLSKLMEEMGIGLSTQNESVYKLLLWNDEVNSMEHVMEALITICGIKNEDAFRIMLEAHSKGKSIAKTGSYDDMVSMKDALNKQMIEATVEK